MLLINFLYYCNLLCVHTTFIKHKITSINMNPHTLKIHKNQNSNKFVIEWKNRDIGESPYVCIVHPIYGPF